MEQRKLLLGLIIPAAADLPANRFTHIPEVKAKTVLEIQTLRLGSSVAEDF